MTSEREGTSGVLKIEFRPLLVSGMTAMRGSSTVILIDSDQSEDEQNRALWHEAVHVLMLGAGVEIHDETKVESMAMQLAAACPDFAAFLKCESGQSPGKRMG